MKKAFTLAEVLITLGIIGVVASMTLPTIIQNYREKATVTKVKKAYSQLAQAYNFVKLENGTPDEWSMSTSDDEEAAPGGGSYNAGNHAMLANMFAKHMKVIKNCIGMSSSDVAKYCTKEYSGPASYSSFRIADGTTIIFRTWSPECNGSYGETKSLREICGAILIDTNGSGKPDTLGQDIFAFYIGKNGIFPFGSEMDRISFDEYCDINKDWGVNYNGHGNGEGCTAWVMYNENMDYLHCDGLAWSGKKTCK